MSHPAPDVPVPDDDSDFDSLDCQIIIDDRPGDTTVRPPRPVLLKLGLAEREKIERWQKRLNAPKAPPEDSRS